jgi:hypothetical protein
MAVKVELGDKAKDTVTGFEGICVARTEWLNGCWRITLQSDKLNKDGQPQEGVTFDEPQLVVTKPKRVAAGPRTTGGPAPTPRQHRGPAR